MFYLKMERSKNLCFIFLFLNDLINFGILLSIYDHLFWVP